MIRIVAAMCVAGDSMFFRFASYSIPSFLRNNASTDLHVFTDNPERIEKYQRLSDRLVINDLHKYFDENKELVETFRSKGRTREILRSRRETYGFNFEDIFPVIMPLMADDTLKGKGYDYILKVDSDGYFAGGDMMAMVKADISNYSYAEVFLVERKHTLMAHYGGGMPGSGFTLWRVGSRFIPEYIRSFTGSQQVTILNMRCSQNISLKTLCRPGYHFVRPFWKAKETGNEFTKEIASQFLPAYFHLHGQIALEGYEKLEEWFGDSKTKMEEQK